MSKPFALSTSDPRFDKDAPVMINGFRYVPAKLDDCGNCENLRQQIETHVALGRGRERNIKRLITERDALQKLVNVMQDQLEQGAK